MNTVQKLTSKIIIGIDRIDIGFPERYTAKFKSKITKDYSYKDKKSKPTARYAHRDYFIDGGRVQLSTLKPNTPKHCFVRSYINLLDPTDFTQSYIKELLSYSTPGIGFGQKSPKVYQLEVSYDFYADTESDLVRIRNFVENHFILKHRRSDSSSYYRKKDKNKRKSKKQRDITFYQGRKGNIRKGSKGTRSYLKDENGDTFYRFEVQLNEPYLKKIGFTYMDLPVSPFYFQALDLVDILGDFSLDGILKVSKAILKKQKYKVSSPNFRARQRKMAETVSDRILGPGSRGPKRSIYGQIFNLNELKAEEKLTTNFKPCFPQLDEVRQLVACHTAVSYPEENTSKRMTYGCTE